MSELFNYVNNLLFENIINVVSKLSLLPSL